MDHVISKDSQSLQEKYPDYIRSVERNYLQNFIFLVLDSSAFSFSVTLLSQDTILPLFVSRLTNLSFWVGLVPAIYFLGYYVPQLIGAYLVHGKPRRKMAILWIAIAERVGILIIALVAQMIGVWSKEMILGLFFFAYLVFAITNGLIGPAYSDYISKSIIHSRGLFYGAMTGVGGVIGLGASLLAQHYLDAIAYPANLQLLFWVSFGVSFVSPFLIAGFRETPFPEVIPEEPLKKFIGAIPSRIRQFPRFQRYLIARSLVGFGFMASSFYAIFAVHSYGLSEGSFGLFTLLIFLAKSIMGFVWGWIGDHLGYRRVLAGISLILAAEALMALVNPGVYIFYVIAFCIGAIYAATWTCDPNMVFEIAPPSETSRFIGIANTLIGPVMMVAPILGGFLVDKFSYQVLFWTAFVLALISLPVVLWATASGKTTENIKT
jgi:MFS family permease